MDTLSQFIKAASTDLFSGNPTLYEKDEIKFRESLRAPDTKKLEFPSHLHEPAGEKLRNALIRTMFNVDDRSWSEYSFSPILLRTTLIDRFSKFKDIFPMTYGKEPEETEANVVIEPSFLIDSDLIPEFKNRVLVSCALITTMPGKNIVVEI